MPPQQSHGLLDGLNQGFGFGAHYKNVSWWQILSIREANRRLTESGAGIAIFCARHSDLCARHSPQESILPISHFCDYCERYYSSRAFEAGRVVRPPRTSILTFPLRGDKSYWPPPKMLAIERAPKT
jgi:hypothetical protein